MSKCFDRSPVGEACSYWIVCFLPAASPNCRETRKVMFCDRPPVLRSK
ncbi:hypothetical protein [Microcoleus sp. N3A4]